MKLPQIEISPMKYMQPVSDYALIHELERRLNAMIENRGCLSKDFIKKLETLKQAAESVSVHF